MRTFSETLKYLRKRDGLSQQELGDKIGVVKSTVSMYEQNTRKPSYEILEAIADYFNVDMDFLIGKSDVERRYTYDPFNSTSPDATPHLTPAEERMVESYRRAPQQVRDIVDVALAPYSPTASEDAAM